MFIVEHMLLCLPEWGWSEVDVEKQAWACKFCWLEPYPFSHITLQFARREQCGSSLTPTKTSLSPSTTQIKSKLVSGCSSQERTTHLQRVFAALLADLQSAALLAQTPHTRETLSSVKRSHSQVFKEIDISLLLHFWQTQPCTQFIVQRLPSKCSFLHSM